MVCSGRIELRSWEYGLFIESRTKEWRIGFV